MRTVVACGRLLDVVDDSSAIPEALVSDDAWLAVPEVIELTGRSLATVKMWLQEREIVGMRRGNNNALRVPALFVTPAGPLKFLQGTISTLADSGYSDQEIIEWLYHSDSTLLGGSAIASLCEGNKTEVRRRAQEAAF